MNTSRPHVFPPQTYCCVPFLIIRAISDKADDSAQMDYDEFEKKAVEHSVKILFYTALC